MEATLRKTDPTATIQGVRISWPRGWTLVQLAGETAEGGWPTLQLTNYMVDLEGSSCPHPVTLPPTGVLMYVERVNEAANLTLPESPADSHLTLHKEGVCGQAGTKLSWRSGDATYEARLLAGPDASPADQDRLVASLAGIVIEDPDAAELWHPSEERRDLPPSVFLDEPQYVVAIPRGAGFPKDHVVLVPPQNDPQKIPIGSGGGSGTVLDVKPYDPFHFAGDSGLVTGDGAPVVVESIGYAALEVDRVVLLGHRGEEVEVSLGPSLARYGVDLRPTFVRFEAPLVGYWVALDKRGNEIKRHRYQNWPPGYP